MSKVVGWLLRVRSAECGVRPEHPAALPQQHPTVLPLVVARDWTPDDQKNLVNFLASPTGMTLIQRMQCVGAANARRGAQDFMHAPYSAGRTTGFFDATEWLLSQAHIEFEQRIGISGASSDLDATSAQPLHGEAALREHYSP